MLDATTAVVIEPDRDVASALSSSLKYVGLREIVTAHDVVSALAVLARIPVVDCVIADLGFPPLQVFEMARHVAGLLVPAIFTTADQGRAEAMGFRRRPLLCKPFGVRVLLECLRIEIDRFTRLHAAIAANWERCPALRARSTAEWEHSERICRIIAADRERRARTREESRSPRQEAAAERQQQGENLRDLGFPLPPLFRPS
ncbi:Response regulator [Rhodovastum atsumiense]|uniref:Response regulator n=1 Tax=Rhodovastum atsumiense TaxID=504468 RepID=A0A5M6ILP1_9PROT|nr:response regulator [Rhodovastum atsumiense]KAA5609193.1 response regulator [Rhodovastum atsumiense]CAH2602803.1 Response regulator [Rhodovastum atsumiense]